MLMSQRAGRIWIRRRVYVAALMAGLAVLFGVILQDAQVTHSRGAVAVLAVPPARLKALTSGAQMDGFGAWSPDGKQVAFMRDGRIWLMAADGSAARAVTGSDKRQSAWDAVPAWQPDGKLIAFARLSPEGDPSLVMTVDPASGAERQVGEEPEPVGHVAWDPSGKLLYYTTPQRLMRLDAARGKVDAVLTVDGDWDMLAGGLAISRDGSEVIFGAGPREETGIRYDLWSAPLTGKQAEPTRLTKDGGIMPSFDRAGRRMVYRGPRRNSGIFLLDLRSRESTRLLADEPRAMYFHPAISPDGSQLLLSRLMLDSGPATERGGGRFTSHLYLHALEGD